MRVFAGPNGSGKSSLKSLISPSHLGVYVNADEIEAAIRGHGFVDLAEFGLGYSAGDLRAFLSTSELFRKAGSEFGVPDSISISGSRVSFLHGFSNSYPSAAIAEFVREELFLAGISFTFETVLSHQSKIELMRRALGAGFRVYLYYIATANSAINIGRVRNRVLTGGHDVPEDKIVSRYERSLDLLYDAIRQSSRAYIFDNSTDDETMSWIAEFAGGNECMYRTEEIPAWFAEKVVSKANLT